MRAVLFDVSVASVALGHRHVSRAGSLLPVLCVTGISMHEKSGRESKGKEIGKRQFALKRLESAKLYLAERD